MAFLVAGFAVMAVIDADDAQIGRVEHRAGGERAEAHQQLPIAGNGENFPIGLGKGKAQAHAEGGAHRTGKAIDVGAVIGHGGEFLRRAGKAGDDKEVERVRDQSGDGLATVECGRGQVDVLDALMLGHDRFP